MLDSLRSMQRGQAPEGAHGERATTAPEPGTMVDRTGELGDELMRVINHELIPLVSDCHQQALERQPRLQGMLALGVKLAGAEEIGEIIEAVEAAPGNEVDDAELVECVRQSAFSIRLPAPRKSGRGDFLMTIPLGDPPSGDAGR